ncbi:5-formyltetrahydrofolate cyclo-ligase [Pantoea sp. Nvir]|uniref:5-formyltetrahydrofolate cyclo-ligase n=1 Tax=Pantoea sp. Nvir TaxID=2576760 RepID=UPI0013597194|nr:5-formyltetrahydrofolate cyclo-ligase [Pantoea sp. Nvir]MXP66749.1 5-formyltetrahydrofolate cyclo-ligase [Pantoea sp. Nvir]CAJ0990940.1 5-formyltetrahydrofolate cyclo-ligase [Pantoea sp. Nvir]
MSHVLLLEQRNFIRQHLRNLRRSLTEEQQQRAADMLTERAVSFEGIASAVHIALFIPVDGEINTLLLSAKFWKQKKQIYLPVLHPFAAGHLLFLSYTPQTPLVLNKLNIPEPPLDVRQIITLDRLDVMIVPLVAFDNRGQRLGMGGGFYDRALQNWRQQGFLPIGVAHDFQKVEKLPVMQWDIALPVVLTPSQLWQWE